MTKTRAIILLFLACCVDEPLSDVADAGPLDVTVPSCEPCNGPGCETMDEACHDVESASFALMCDDGVVIQGDEFETRDVHGRVVRCRYEP